MGTNGSKALSLLLEAVCKAQTGVISWQNDKRKRMAWFEGGGLILLQSNLKSETPERIAEKFPDSSPDEQRRRMLETRLRGLLSEGEGEVKFSSGSPPQKDPEDIIGLLHAVSDLLPSPPSQAYPRVVTAPLLQRFPVDPELRAYLWELDGTRDMDEVSSFAPANPDATDRAFRVAFALGVVVDAGKATTLSTVIGAAEPEEAPNATGVFPAGWETERPTRKVHKPGNRLGMDDLFSESAAPEDPIKKWFGSHCERIRAAPDHFAVLGVRWDEVPENMRKAYFALARDLHPDRFGEAPPNIQQQATELFDKARAAWEVLGDDQRREQYIGRVIRGEKTEEEKAAEQVQKIMDAEGMFKRGLSDLNSGRIAQAHELFHKAHELVPQENEFVAYLGYTSFRVAQGKDEAAAAVGYDLVREALKVNDQLDNVWVLLGMMQRIKGDDPAARRAFIKALQLKPANPDAMREMKRLEQTRSTTAEEQKTASGGFFSRLFGRK